MICAIPVPNDPCVPALGFTCVVEGHVVTCEVVVSANRFVHVVALARVEARAIVRVRLGVVVHGLGVGASVDGDGHLAAFGVHANGVGRFVHAVREGVCGGHSGNGHVDARGARFPAVVVHEEVVASVCQASVGRGHFKLVVVVHQIHVRP